MWAPASSPITTHVLDTVRGRPAGGMPVELDIQRGPSAWESIAVSETDADGRVNDFFSSPADRRWGPGTYRMTFHIELYAERLAAQGQAPAVPTMFFPVVPITFRVTDCTLPVHLPMLLTPFGFSTYRGTHSNAPPLLPDPSRGARL
jgi:hydroxyisourate hydrolase